MMQSCTIYVRLVSKEWRFVSDGLAPVAITGDSLRDRQHDNDEHSTMCFAADDRAVPRTDCDSFLHGTAGSSIEPKFR